MKLPHVTTEPRALASGGVKSFRRPSFTLVELLVVIAIIGVLASLLLAAVFKAMDVAYEAQTRTDITQLSASMQAFQIKYSVPYIPSRFILCKDYLNYFSNRDPNQGTITPLHRDSLEYLSRVFARITTAPPGQTLPSWALPPFPAWAGTPQPGNVYTGIDWNQTGIPDQPIVLSVYPAGNVPCLGAALEGEQCLVFFLGGVSRPSPNYPNGPPTPQGFSTNPANPAAGSDFVPPFFEFKSNRLVYQPGTDPGYTSYLDGYGKTPYAFFSSYKNSNGYNRYVYISNPYLPTVPGNPVTSDCQALNQGLGVFPYIQAGLAAGPSPLPAPVPQYLNAQTYQIISAGKNYNFGSGSVIGAYPPVPLPTPYNQAFPTGNQVWAGFPTWTPGTASQLYPQGQAGYDDISNFYDRTLGVASP